MLTARSLRAIIRDPRMIVFSLLQPLVMLVLFSQIFASIAKTPGFPSGVSYIDYLMPAILVNTAMGSAVQSGVGLVTDMKNGVIARFRSLPIRLGSVLFARSLSDIVRTGIQLVVMLLFATALFGFAPAGGMLGVLGAWALGLVVGWGLGWVFIAAGAWLRSAEMMQMVGFLLMFPLMFASSAYVPISGLPGLAAGGRAREPDDLRGERVTGPRAEPAGRRRCDRRAGHQRRSRAGRRRAGRPWVPAAAVARNSRFLARRASSTIGTISAASTPTTPSATVRFVAWAIVPIIGGPDRKPA